jgi:hypothetical protein
MDKNGNVGENFVNGGTSIFQHSPENNHLKREKEAGCQPDAVRHL